MAARVIVIGGDAAGMTAAAQLNKLAGDDVAITVIERGGWTSYSACGIPYWAAGDVDGPSALIARTAEVHRANGIDVRLHTEALGFDPEAHTVSVSHRSGPEDVLTYDHLVVATGAEPVRPPIPGIDAKGVLGVQTVDDGTAMIEALNDARKVVVVGSGYIGLEMAEACVRRGLDTTVVDRRPTPLHMIEPVLGATVATAMTGLGIRLVSDAEATGFRLGDDGSVVAVETDAGEYEADVVLLGLGVRARTELAEKAGLPLGMKGGIIVDAHQRVEGFDDIWSGGDCVVTLDRITGERMHVPLGTHANKHGLVLAANLAAVLRGEAPTREFPGVVRTAVTKICSLEIGRTGLGERQAREAGFDPVVVWIDTTTTAGYMPDVGELTVLMVADRGSRVVLGVQVVGAEDSALRIDAAAMALWSGLTVDELMMTDLAYAPPFSSVWSPIQVAARAAVRAIDG